MSVQLGSIYKATAEDKLALARAAAIKKAPYYARTLLKFVRVPAPGIDTIGCTKKMILMYNPEWVMAKEQTVPALTGVLVHEVCHVLRDHLTRTMTDDPELLNIAGDMAINPGLRDTGWELPPDGIYPDQYGFPDGLSQEEYYQLLRQLPPGQRKGKGKGKHKESGDGDSEPQTSDDPSDDDKHESGVCAGCCGSAGGHTRHPEIEQELDALPDVGRSKAEVQTMVKDTFRDIKEHVRAHGRGTIPGDFIEATPEFMKPPKVSWQQELAYILQTSTDEIRSGSDDYSIRRPSKRSILYDCPRPGLVCYSPEVAIVRDSSCSMGRDALRAAVVEAFRIMRALDVEHAWFTDADTRVLGWQRVGDQFFKALTSARGRGGTDFNDAIESAQRLNPRPDLLVYATDGEAPPPDRRPTDMSVVWVIVGSHDTPVTDWGRTVFVDKNR